MEDREDQFLKGVFKNFNPETEPDKEFNDYVFQKIYTQQNAGMQMLHYLRILGPLLFIFLLVGILFLVFKGELVIKSLTGLLPALKPWHIFMAFIIIYFHFVRSMLILAFLYFKKWFNRAGIAG